MKKKMLRFVDLNQGHLIKRKTFLRIGKRISMKFIKMTVIPKTTGTLNALSVVFPFAKFIVPTQATMVQTG